jgi:hypothetical protein
MHIYTHGEDIPDRAAAEKRRFWRRKGRLGSVKKSMGNNK